MNYLKIKRECEINQEIKNKIVKILTYLCYNMSYKGSKYLVDVIYFIYINRDNNYENLKRDVYPVIAKKYNESVHNIKCNINRATELMYCNCIHNKISEYFEIKNDEKPNLKTIIFTIINKLS